MEIETKDIRSFDALAISAGKFFIDGIIDLYEILRFLALSFLSRPKFSTIMEQMFSLGMRSIPICIMASIFVGFVATWQVQYLIRDFVGLQYLGMMVLRAVTSQLWPTLVGLVLAGRIGAKVAAEVGTMRVTEQIDAMVCLSLNPLKSIIAPRIIAAFVMTPVMFVFGSIAAIVASQFIATVAFNLPPATFYNSMRLMFNIGDIWMGLTKSFVFGGITGLVGCYFGYTTTGGAAGVGASTRNAVVTASVMILIANLIISNIMS